jgi:hypothetical protein
MHVAAGRDRRQLRIFGREQRFKIQCRTPPQYNRLPFRRDPGQQPKLPITLLEGIFGPGGKLAWNQLFLEFVLSQGTEHGWPDVCRFAILSLREGKQHPSQQPGCRAGAEQCQRDSQP